MQVYQTEQSYNTERPHSATSGGYDETSMQMAITAVEQQEMNMSHPGICYGIPLNATHLQDHSFVAIIIGMQLRYI